MIRSLSDINEEFLSEIIGAQSLAPDISAPLEIGDTASYANDDVEDLIASLETGPLPGADDIAPPLDEESKPEYMSGSRSNTSAPSGPKLSREFVSIAGIIIGIILIIIAAVMLVESSSGLRGDAANGADQTGSSDASADAGPGDETAGPPGENAEPGAGEYNAALDNLENELYAARESQGEDEEADLSLVESESLAEMNIASLYLHILGDEHMESADINTASEIPPERKYHLTERIGAHISDEASREAASLPSNEEINSDLEFTSLTEPANALINAVNAGREDKAAMLEVIGLREKAYGIYPLSVLKKLLAADYEDLGLYYAPAHASESFDAFMYSIKYRMAYLSELHPESKAHRTEIGRVGRTFAEISEIGDLDAARKWHAKLIASCLFDISASKAY
jgi:hypothetical protein